MQEKSDLCPICDAELESKADYIDFHLLLELHQKCPNKHYYYDLAYGNTEVMIGEDVFAISYSSDYEEYKLFIEKTKIASNSLRKQCQK